MAYTFWCPICQAEKDGAFYTVGSRDGMNAFLVCESHVPHEHRAENNPNHLDHTLRDLILEDGQLVELPKPEPAE